jgi:small conductance mechanosensitive channel
VPNGQITSIINLTRGFANAVMDVGVAYRENTDEVMAVMREVARELRADDAFAPRILDDLEIAGVDQWADSSVVIRCRIRCNPGDQWTVRREYLRRLKHAFDRTGIEIPFPHVTVYAGQDKRGGAPALPLQLQRGARAAEATAGVQT